MQNDHACGSECRGKNRSFDRGRIHLVISVESNSLYPKTSCVDSNVSPLMGLIAVESATCCRVSKLATPHKKRFVSDDQLRRSPGLAQVGDRSLRNGEDSECRQNTDGGENGSVMLS